MGKISKIWSTTENLWYHELRVVNPYDEKDYQNELFLHLKTLFPDYFVFHYYKNIRKPKEKSGSRPDFAMVRRDFQEWWIVEVETIRDKIKHVKKQIEDFSEGQYNSVIEAKYLSQNTYETVSKSDLQKVTVKNPHVLVIVDGMNSKWLIELKDLAPKICLFKLFKGAKNGKFLLSISGDYPYIFEAESHCHYSNTMRNFMQVQNPEILDIRGAFAPPRKLPKYKEWGNWLKQNILGVATVSVDLDVFTISYDGQLTEWKKVTEDNKVFLQPIGPVATRATAQYVLKRTKSNDFILELK